MIAYAAREPEIWPHVVALFWQALWVAITVSVAAGWFKRGVLKSGPSRRRSERMRRRRSEEHTSELQSLLRTSYAVFCLKKKNKNPLHPLKNAPNITQSTNSPITLIILQ